MIEAQRAYAGRELHYLTESPYMGRADRHKALRKARRAVKRLATLPRIKLVQLSPSRRDEWREMRAPQATHEDKWLARNFAFLWAWGRFGE